MIKNQPQSGYFKTLSILFYALLAGQVIFLLVVTGLTVSGFVEPDEALGAMLLYAAPVLLLGSSVLAKTIYKRRLPEIAAIVSLADRLAQYRGLSVLRFALVQGSVLFAIVSFMITGSQPIALIAAAGILFFITLRPTKEKIIQDLQLSGTEAAALESDQ